ncbi:tektin-1 [Nasonia vitripennis]|uniref:Tektin n=1 Tax=Nasonia vitripennis TaxID=7425 RepID=A0A7M7H5I6_NASVI|nr:tektin-1 [Nasonia vitripennis]XP_008209389.1 tektin-1 [Nasonia vitripennis]
MVNSLKINQPIEQHNTSRQNPKFTIKDWYYNNHLRNHCSQIHQELARQIIAKSNQVCKFTTEKVISNRDQTNHCLNERINEIEFCKQELIRNRNELPLEIDALISYKNRLLDSLSSLRQNALDICEKCLSARERRLGIDLVNDNVEKQLRQECKGIKCADQLMTKTLEQTIEQIRRLKSTLYHIDHDLEDKENSLRIDRHNSTLKETNLNLSIHHGKSTLDASSITLEEWEMKTKKNIDESTKEIQTAKKIRSHTDIVLKQIINDLMNQKNLTNEAFTQRIKETKEAKEKLELQHSEIMRQANEMTRNITRLEKIIAEKEGFIALAHTRLGNRCQRPGLELTCDHVEKSLSKEIFVLREVVTRLQQTLFEAQASLRFLLKMQIQLEEDINIKTNTLKIDEVECMTMRQSIDYHVF